jgi:hypothetical protein
VQSGAGCNSGIELVNALRLREKVEVFLAGDAGDEEDRLIRQRPS